MKRSNLLIRSALLLTLLFSPLYGSDLYDEKKVGHIEFVLDSPEDNPLDQKALLNKLKTKEGQNYEQTTFDQDLKRLSEEYDVTEVDYPIKDGQLNLKIHLKRKSVIRSIQFDFKGEHHVKGSSLQDELDVKPGTVYNRTDFDKQFNKLKKYYIFKKGYFEAQIDYTLEPVPNTNEVDVVIHINEGRPGRIEKIVWTGFTKEEKSAIEDQMVLKNYNFLFSWITGSGLYSDEAKDQDQALISNYLQNEGYADASVNIDLKEDPANGKLILEISAVRGAKYHIGSIKIEGNSLLTEEEIRSKLQVHEGSTYSPLAINETVQAIKKFYGSKGYIEATVQPETAVREDEPIFDLTFTVDEGEQYTIGCIYIFGNVSTKCNVILRESLLVPGETFDSRKLEATQHRLEAVGYFKSVNVYAVRTSDDVALGDNTRTRDVYIEVEEASTGNVSLFMGFSSSDDVFGGLDLTERNFHIANVGKALTGDLSSLRGGGEYFHVRGTAGKKQYNVLVSWLNPYVNDSLWRLGVEISSTFSELQSDDTKVITYGGSVYTSYPLSNFWTVGMRERLRHVVDKLNLDAEDSSAIAHESLAATKALFQRDGMVSAFSGNLSYDSVDNSYKPRRGWRSYFEPEIAGIGGRFYFGKLTYTNTIYFPVWKKGTLKLRGDFKFLMPYGSTDKANAPYSERFFLGGDATMRGYKPWFFGPRIYLKNQYGANVPTDTPKGGLSMTYFSLEYNQEIFRMLDLFAFCDVGSLSAQPLTVDKFRASAGGGARLDIGNRTPIMVGWGYVFNHSDRKNKKQPFFFSMGGQF